MEIPENKLIRKIRQFERRSDEVLRGIGDDGAVVAMSEGAYVLVQDAMVEHVHFEFDFVDPYDLGKKALYSNISDVLAMGAQPLYYMVTIAVPDKVTSKEIGRLYRGMNRAAKEFDVIMIGGDTTGSMRDFFIDVSMVGKVVTKSYLGRNKAKAGELIAVTGCLGESAYGLSLLRQGNTGRAAGRFIRRYRAPQPPYGVWKELVKRDITTAMMDISDGLIIDLERMMVESGKGARINLDQVPMPAVLRKEKRENLALAGGEDYQLLFTFPAHRIGTIFEITRMGFPVSIVGEVDKGKGVRVFEKGKEKQITSKGYEHFGDIR